MFVMIQLKLKDINQRFLGAGCMYFKKIKTAVKFFEFFASILMRV